MKTILPLLAAALSLSFLSSSLSAQPSARTLTRKIVPQPGVRGATTNQQPRRVAPQAPALATPAPATSAPTSAVRRPTPLPVVVSRPVDPAKEKAAREKADQKAVEFEKKRADQDYGWAQYALGMRFLTGKGVEKDAEQARKWLEKAAKNGETQAVKKLAELDKELNDGTESGAPGGKPPRIGDAEKAIPAVETNPAAKGLSDR